MDEDIRWKQRFANYRKALQQLTKFIEMDELNELEEQGLIQAFAYTHELSWNVLRDYLLDKGHQNIHGSRDATREAFKLDLISDGDSWMDMIGNRNRTLHSYKLETAEAIADNITDRFFTLFVELEETMQDLLNDK